MKAGFHSTHLYLSDDPEVKVANTRYALFVHERHAFEFGHFTSATATIHEAQEDLTAAGYET